jgi:aryl-alcohol dehydrogenase-like predicted oxidoreductase
LNEAAMIIARATQVGVDLLDTAVAYGDAEQRLGEVGVSHLKVVTKLPQMSPESAPVGPWVRSQVAGSLSRLGVTSFYGLMLHQPSLLLSPSGDALFSAISQMKHDGLVEKIGISVYSPDEVFEISRRFPIDLVQAPFNVIDRRIRDTGCLDFLFRRGIEFHARSIFLQGLLLMSPDQHPSWSNRWVNLWAKWQDWLSQCNLVPLSASLGFVASDSRVDRMVIGVDSLAQLDQIIHAADGPVTGDVPAELASSDPDLINPSRWSGH